MKCQILFPRKTKKNSISLSSAVSAHSMVSFKLLITTTADDILIFFFFFFFWYFM